MEGESPKMFRATAETIREFSIISMKNIDFLCQQSEIIAGMYIGVARQLTNPYVRRQPYTVDFMQLPIVVETPSGEGSTDYTAWLLGRKKGVKPEVKDITTESMPIEPDFFDYLIEQLAEVENRIGNSHIARKYKPSLRKARDYYIESRVGWKPYSQVSGAEGIGAVFGDAALMYVGIEE